MATSFFLLTLILPIFIFFFFFDFSHATVFEIRNSCPYTVWAAAVPGGGMRLNEGQMWNITVSSNTSQGRIWGRTNCKSDESGNLTCESGDCGGLPQCEGYGTPPYTMAEYSLKVSNGMDFFDLSLVDGFNIPMEFGPTSEGCSRGANCTGDVNGLCPNELRDPGGCNNPCTVFKNNQYCCTSGSCNATVYSMLFKENCPDAISYPRDDGTTFSCPAGTNYRVVFCPP